MAEDSTSISSVHVIFCEYLGILVTRHLYKKIIRDVLCFHYSVAASYTLSWRSCAIVLVIQLADVLQIANCLTKASMVYSLALMQ